MPSLDGYSLNEKIDKTFAEVQKSIIAFEEQFGELYDYLAKTKIEQRLGELEKCCNAKATKTTKPKKGGSNAKS
tara:strand:+ start:561 stop:782 length:222 start_codon:yes stop_codon:yes gene_type:complete